MGCPPPPIGHLSSKKHLCGAFPTLLLYTAAKILIDSTSLSLISMAQMLQMLWAAACLAPVPGLLQIHRAFQVYYLMLEGQSWKDA